MDKQRVIGFSTFLKLIELDEQKKRSTLRGYKRGGGFNYWRPLQILSNEVISNKLSAEELPFRMDSFAKGHQKKYNENALLKLLLWKSKRNVTAKKKVERFDFKLGRSGFTIKFEPEVAFELNGSNYLMHLWATNTPTLSENTLSVGLYIFKLAAKRHDLKNWNYLIYDTIKDKTFGEFDILSNSESLLKEQILIIRELWENENFDVPPARDTIIDERDDYITALN